MSLYDEIPEGLFSILASKNKGLYSKALFVVFEAFNCKLKIRKDELVSMLESRLEDDIYSADLDDELVEGEVGLSGKAHFLVRKLRDTGWILVGYEEDFVEYVDVPSYSYKIIQTLVEVANPTKKENFAYVYSTVSSLKNANESGEPREMIAALNNGEERTKQLVDSLKMVYNDIKRYNQMLVEKIKVNDVLREHYEKYQEEIVEKILAPLKIKDSVPKYKGNIRGILNKWLYFDNALEEMTEYLLNQQGGDREQIQSDLREKIHYIVSTYESLEQDYIAPVDIRNRRYTRSTSLKIDYLINADQTVKGNLIYILRSLSDKQATDRKIEIVNELCELYELSFIDGDALYQRQKGKPREKRSELVMPEDHNEFIEKAKVSAAKLLNKRYGMERINNFVADLLGENESISIGSERITDDESFVLALLSVAHSKSKLSEYNVEIAEDFRAANGYEIPRIIYTRRKSK